MLYLLIILFPITMAASAFILRRRPALVIMLGLGTISVQLLIGLQIPVDDPTRFLGVTLTLSPLNQIFMLLFLGVGGAALIAAANLPHGENFVPISLLTLAQIVAVLLLQDPFITALVLVTTGLTAVLAIVDLPAGASVLVGRRALATALKYLVLMVVAGVLLYIAYVLTDIFRPGELPDRISLARFILALLAAGFALRLALVPFHTWLVDLVAYAEALVALLIIALLTPASLLVLLLTLQSFPTLILEGEQALTVLRGGALLSALLAGGLALTAGSMRQRVAYIILGDCGMIFYGLASLSLVGLSGAVLGALSQTLAVALTLISLALLERPDGRPPGVARGDLLWRWPIAGVGLVGGGLALVGVPPLSGGVSRQLIFQAAAGHGWAELLGLLLATGLAVLALVQLAAQYLIGPGDPQPSVEPLLIGETELDRPAQRRLEPEPRSAALLVIILLGASLAVGLYPQPLLATIDAAVRSLAFLRAL